MKPVVDLLHARAVIKRDVVVLRVDLRVVG